MSRQTEFAEHEKILIETIADSNCLASLILVIGSSQENIHPILNPSYLAGTTEVHKVSPNTYSTKQKHLDAASRFPFQN
jgi:hypothetical protein